MRGRWLLVNSDGKSGWVYFGNVSEKKPPKENKKDLLPFVASDTTSTAAARGLSEISKDYAHRKNKEDSARDVEWMEKIASGISSEQVRNYMKTNKIGEYGE